ncbi:DNA repair protein RadA [bacterium]|nr:DNA repair protein RadA [bacterium]
MAKQKTAYECSACGYTTLKWFGRCPECQEWSSAVERIEQQQTQTEHPLFVSSPRGKVIPLSEVKEEDIARITSGVEEFDRMLGGGVTVGGYNLISGPPGVGKSTLMHQIALAFAKNSKKVVYLSAEESPAQIKQRFSRLQKKDESLPDSLFVSDEANIEQLRIYLSNHAVDILFVDSIQAVYVPSVSGIPGSPTQIKECAVRLMDIAKRQGVTVFVVGHITKSGSIAGPMLLEHMVDTVLYFEGDTSLGYRMLRSSKNRFGPTDEVGIFTMTSEGLEPVKDPGRFFISDEENSSSGSIMSIMLEGTRPFLIEIQALATSSNFPQPRRVLTGFDANRVAMIAAVLEKRVDIFLSGMDLYLNVVGGIKVKTPSVDLPIAAALIAGIMNISVSRELAFIGEVGLGGEVRRVAGAELMIKEAERLGIKRICLPHRNFVNSKKRLKSIELLPVKTLFDVVEIIRTMSPFDS